MAISSVYQVTGSDADLVQTYSDLLDTYTLDLTSQYTDAQATINTSLTSAQVYATAALASENAAATSAAAGAISASTATTQAASATTSASTATTKASEASTSAANAASSAATATTKASEASTSATNSAASAVASANSATNSATSATASANSATAAAASEAAASVSEANAGTSETNVSTSETNAASSASSASTSATTATTQAGIATDQAVIATTQATNSSNSATSSANSATASANSATSASNAQTAAESARDATLAAYDNFDDRYLGTKSSAPTLDNDGDALVAGALYFDSTSGAMQVYTGSAWVAAYVSGTGFLALTGGTMSGDINFGDNDKAIFGAGSDLQVYHSGTHSWINENGTGNLYIQSSGAAVNITNGSTRNIAQFNTTAGTATLFYDNGTSSSAKLATTNTGVDVTGTVTADGLTVDTDTLHVDATNNRVGIGTTSSSDALTVSTSAVNGGVTVSGSTDPQYFLNSSGGNQARFKINDATPMLQTGSWTNIPVGFYTNGTERLRITSAGNVGINTSSPTHTLDVNGPAKFRATSAPTWDTNSYVWTESGFGLNVESYQIKFNAGATRTERVRIDTAGNLLVGYGGQTTTAFGQPQGMTIGSLDNTALQYYLRKGNQVEARIGFKASTDTNFYVGSGGGTGPSGIGVYGVYLTNLGNSWNSVSDETQKTIVENIENASEKVSTLRTVMGYYNNDENETRRPFLIAQDVQAVLPEAVSVQDIETGVLGMSYTDVIPLLTAAIKEQRETINALEARITALESN